MSAKFHVVMVQHEDGEELPILLDGDRQPIACVSEYLITDRRNKVTPNTMRIDAATLGHFYAWGLQEGINILQRLKSGSGFTKDEIASRLFPWLRQDFRKGRVTKMVVSRDYVDTRMNIVRTFIETHMDAAITRLPVGDARIRDIQAKKDSMIRVFERLKTDIGNGDVTGKEALTVSQTDRLLVLCSPGHPNNPWKPAYQERNYLILLMLLSWGVRAGELLGLYLKDCQLAGTSPVISIQRRPDDPNDKRRKKPQVKTLSRVLPCEPPLVRRLRDYITNKRKAIPGASKTPFLILARDGSAMSLSGLHGVIKSIGRKHPDFAGFTAHICRHTALTRLREQAQALNIDELRMKDDLKYYAGWSSDQSEVYTKQSIRQETMNIGLNHQRAMFAPLEDQIPF